MNYPSDQELQKMLTSCDHGRRRMAYILIEAKAGRDISDATSIWIEATDATRNYRGPYSDLYFPQENS